MASTTMNWRFVRRGLIIGLAWLASLLIAAALILPRLIPQPPSGPIPPGPTIAAPRGSLPQGPVALQEWAVYADDPARLAGCGFLFAAANGDVVGATTAHSLDLGSGTHILERIEFRVAGGEDSAASFSALYGLPGRPRLLGMDLTVDYVLLHPAMEVDPALVLEPDPRGGPQPGERVVLYSGLGEAGEGRYEGSVLAADDRGAWIVMDDIFEPGMMSGSPVFSIHSGKVVGMASAATLREGRLLLGIHPIASLLAKAGAAEDFPRIMDFRR